MNATMDRLKERYAYRDSISEEQEVINMQKREINNLKMEDARKNMEKIKADNLKFK